MKNLFITLLCFVSVLIVNAQHDFDPELIKKHVSILAADSMEGRGFGTNEMAREYILEQFKSAGFEPAVNGAYIDTFSVRISTVRVMGKNIVGIIPGSDPELKNEYIVLGAHYDHMGYEIKNGEKIIYNGADDNASGVAAIIEIGKQLIRQQDQLKRSIVLVAFDGEESGLHGSQHFVADEVVPVDNTGLMFSLDMVGMYKAHGGVDLHGINSLEEGAEILDRVKQDVNITKTGKSIAMRTDTQPFGNKGIPAIHVFTGTESPYHKPEDDSHLLDYEGMAEICGLIYRFTNEAANAETLKPIESLAEEADEPEYDAFIAGLRVNFGSGYHNYKDQFFQAKSLIAVETGFFAQVRLARHWRIQPEVVYELKGSESAFGNVRLHAVTVPVNVMLTTGDPVGFQPMAFLMAGGYYSYNFAGSVEDNAADYEDLFTEDDYGFTVGAGVQMNKIQMGFYSKYGLQNISNTESFGWGEIRYNNAYFMFGYTF
ncbi:MAG: M20/M25/M40 family metallo-hydrolase [Bacteroidota bacterium]